MKNKYVFEEQVMMGMRDHTGQWWEVVEHCARCGECCEDSGPDWYFAGKEKGCTYLELEADGKTYRCDLKGYRPFGCCCNNPHTIPEYCSVRLQKITEEEAVELLLKAA